MDKGKKHPCPSGPCPRPPGSQRPCLTEASRLEGPAGLTASTGPTAPRPQFLRAPQTRQQRVPLYTGPRRLQPPCGLGAAGGSRPQECPTPGPRSPPLWGPGLRLSLETPRMLGTWGFRPAAPAGRPGPQRLGAEAVPVLNTQASKASVPPAPLSAPWQELGGARTPSELTVGLDSAQGPHQKWGFGALCWSCL